MTVFTTYDYIQHVHGLLLRHCLVRVCGGVLLQYNQWCVLQLHRNVFNSMNTYCVNCSSEIHTLVVNLQPCMNQIAKINNLTLNICLKKWHKNKRSLKIFETCGSRPEYQRSVSWKLLLGFSSGNFFYFILHWM